MLKRLGVVLLVVLAATVAGAAIGTIAAKVLKSDYERGK
jgi:hypothetical protein